jgi:hypothetical protein
VAVVEDVADAAASAFDDLAASLGGAYAGVLCAYADTFAYVADTLHRVEGDDVGGTFAGALGDVAGGPASTFADVTGTAADIAAGATAGRDGGLGLGRRGLGSLLLCACRRAGDRQSRK